MVGRLIDKKVLGVAVGLVFIVAFLLRVWHGLNNEFVFYDEGMYLGQNRDLLHLIETHPPTHVGEFLAILAVLFKVSVATAKAFWFFLLNLRVFFVGSEGWFVARLVSIISGFLTLGLTYLFARRFFNNQRVAILSALILAVLPSHVFYSRLGMQESFSTLLLMGGFYFYVFGRGLGWQALLAGLLLTLTYFCNYRMIVAPIFLVVIEAYYFLFLKKSVDIKKLIATVGVFVLIVWWIGGLYQGVNREVTFGWMGHQAHDATGKFDPFKFLSFPLYTFLLEGFFVGIFFWYGLWQVKEKQWSRLLPFLLVLTQMLIFSVAADQGARYLCVVLPFLAISCAQAMDDALDRSQGLALKFVSVVISLSFITMIGQSYALASHSTQYQQAVNLIKAVDPQAKMLATQPLVTQLFVADPKEIQPCPHDVRSLVEMIEKGYYYLIIDPQAYVSWARDDRKFNLELEPFLEDIRSTQPAKKLAHFNLSLLTRFVLDHNEHLYDSIPFILAHKQGANIEIYDLRVALANLVNPAFYNRYYGKRD